MMAVLREAGMGIERSQSSRISACHFLHISVVRASHSLDSGEKLILLLDRRSSSITLQRGGDTESHDSLNATDIIIGTWKCSSLSLGECVFAKFVSMGSGSLTGLL